MPALSSVHVAAVCVVAVLCVSSLPGQGCTAGPPTGLGTVAVLATPCPGGAGPGTTCHVLRISCTGIPDIDVRVRVTNPAAGVPMRGTVLMGVGGGGVGFYGDRVGGAPLQMDLLAAGFRVVDRSWVSGWFNDAAGVRKQSCRYATLLTWVRANLHTGGAFCATGNSGGSGELCYALTTWGRGAILDVAVPTGGPPMSRLDLLCQTPATPQWTSQCMNVVPANVMTCQPGCTVMPGHTVCTRCPTQLRQDSILFLGAQRNFPTTRVHQVIGANDCSSAVPAGMLFHTAVLSEKIVEFPANTPHWVATSQEGRDAILRAILGGAACTPGPASMQWRAMPQVGGLLEIDLAGPAGADWYVALSLTPAITDFAPFGWLFIGSPALVVGNGTLHPMTGRGAFNLAVPNDPILIGFEVFFQGLTGTCLTNQSRVVVAP
ncbi:MAG: hypothetical protein CMJ83_15625 [Planctomycetes bacterium]|nr:hypothetical protein [Planctomycetota bacterium]